MRKILGILLLFSGVNLGACATNYTVAPSEIEEDSSLVFGRIESELSGSTNRWFKPEIRFFEISNRNTDERFRVFVEAEASNFFLPLPPGEYEVSRLQIREGAFRGMTQLALRFQIPQKGIYFLGVWKVKVASPTYDRRVFLTVISDRETSSGLKKEDYPELFHLPIMTLSPDPPQFEGRLYEILPYPRFRYFIRHHTT